LTDTTSLVTEAWQAKLAKTNKDYKTLYFGSVRNMSLNVDGTKAYVVNNRYVYGYDLSIANDLSTAVLQGSYYYYTPLTNDESHMVEISGNGAHLYLASTSSGIIYQFDLATPYDISTISNPNKSINIVSEENKTLSMEMNISGTKMWTTGGTTDEVHQYTLSTPYDITTVVYDDVQFNLNTAAGITTAQSIVISVDGSKMYVFDSSFDELFEFDLSSANDISTATYNGISTWINGASHATMSPDGSKLYASEGSVVVQYSLTANTDDIVAPTASSIAWDLDISSLSYDSKTLSVGSSRQVALSEDGTKMYVPTNRYIREYDLTIPYDISTASYVNQFYYYSAIANDETSFIDISSNGEHIYLTNDSHDQIEQLTMSTPYDITTAGTRKTINISHLEIQPTGISFSPDGKKFIMVGINTDRVYEFVCSTPWDISTSYWTGARTYVGLQCTSPRSCSYSSDGTKMYVFEHNGTIFEYQLSTPFAVVTANINNPGETTSFGRTLNYITISKNGKYIYGSDGTFVYQYKIDGSAFSGVSITSSGTTWDFDKTSIIDDYKTIAVNGTISNSTISIDGTKIFVIRQYRYVQEYALSTPFDVSSATYTREFDVYPQQGNDNSYALEFASDGSKFYTIDYDSDYIYEWTMATPWDLTSVTNTGNYYIGSHFTNGIDLAMTYDGKKIYVTGNTSDKIAEFILTTPFDITTAYWTGSQLSVSTQTTEPRSLMLSSDGSKLYLKGSTTTQLYEYSMPTAYDLGTAVYNETITIPSMSGYMSMSHDGKYIYGISSINGVYLQQFRSDGTAHVPVTITPSGTTWDFDKTGIINDQKTISVNGTISNSTISIDGTKIFVIRQYRYVQEYALSTPFDVSSATFIREFDVYPPQGNDNSYALEFASDGSKFYTIDYDSDYIYEWTMATPWDLTSVTNSGNYYIGSHFTNGIDLAMTYDGKKIYVTGNTSDKIAEYILTTPFDITTAYWTGSQLSVSTQTTEPRSLMLSSDGSKLYIKGSTTTQLYEYSMPTAYDLGTAIYNETITIPSISNYMSMSHDGKYIYGISSVMGSYLQQFRSDGTAHTPVTITPSGTTWDFDKTGIIDDHKTIHINNSVENSQISVDGTKMFVMKAQRYVTEYTLSTPFDVSSATFIREFDVYPPQGNDNSYALEVASDGSKFYTIDYDNDYIYEWTMAAPWDLTSITNTGNYYIGSHFTNGIDLAMTYDGKKMYITGNTSDKIAEFVLTTPFDITTAYWTGSQLSVSSQTTEPRSLMLSSDGSKLYLKGSTTTQLYEYSMSTAYDLSSAIYTETITIPSISNYMSMSHDGKYIYGNSSGNSHYLQQFKSDGTAHVPVTITSSGTTWDFDKTSIINDQKTIGLSHDIENSQISVDGTKMFVMKAQRYVTEYTLSTPFDVSSATYTHEFDVYPPQGNDNSAALEVASDGSKFYTIDYDNDYIYEWTMADPWDLTSVTNTGTYAIGSHLTSPWDLVMTYDGKKMYITGHANDKIAEFVLTTPFDITTAYWTGSQLSVSSQTNYPRSLMLSSDGSKLYLKGNSNTQLYEYSMSTAYDLSSAIYESTITIPSMDYTSMSHDGKYIYGRNMTISGKYLQQFRSDGTAHVPVSITSSGTAWSFDTDALQPSGTIGTGFDTDVQNISISVDGTKMFMMSASRYVKEYTLSTPFDTTTATYIQQFDVYPPQGSDSSFALEVTSDGSKFYTIDYDSDLIYQWTMATSWDLTSVTNSGTYYIGQHLTNAFALVMTHDGKKVYVTGYDSDKISEFVLTTPFDITTAYWTGNQISISSQTNYPRSLILSSDGSKLYLKGNNLTQIYEYSMPTAYDLGTAIYTRTITIVTSVNCITTTHDGSILYGVSPFSGSASSIIEFDMNADTSSVQSFSLHAAPWVSPPSETSSSNFNFYVNAAETLFVGTDGSSIFSRALDSDANLGKMSGGSAGRNSIAVGSGVTSVALSLSEAEMYVLKTGSNTITQYTLSTPGDISTATSTTTFTCPAGIIDFSISSDGTRVYMMNSTEIQQFDLSTPWAITSASLATNGTFDMSNEITNPYSLQLTENDTTLNVHDGNTYVKMHRFVMTTPKDITTIAYDAFAQYLDGAITKAFVSSDGTNVIVRNSSDNSFRTFYFDVNNIPQLSFQAPAVSSSVVISTPLVSMKKTLDYSMNATNGFQGFFDDGNKFVTTNGGTITVHDVSTPYDITTGTPSASATHNLSPYNPGIENAKFSADGTKLYLKYNYYYQDNDKKIREITCTSPFNPNGVVASTYNFGSAIYDFDLSYDGTALYVLFQDENIYQYGLATTGSIESKYGTNITFNAAALDSNPRTIQISDDGTKMFVFGITDDRVHQLDMTTAYMLSSATYNGVKTDVISNASRVYITNDGSRLNAQINGTKRVEAYSINGDLATVVSPTPGTAWSGNISTPLVSMKKTLDYSMNATNGFQGFVDDGNKFVTTNGGTITVHDVSTPYDITTGTPSASATHNLSPYNPGIERAKFSADGTKLYLKYNYYYQDNDKKIREITCTSPFNPNGVVAGTFQGDTQSIYGDGIYDMCTAYDKTKMYILNHNEIIYEYVMVTPGSIASMYWTGVTFNAATLDNNPRTIQISDDGTKMFVFGTTDDRVHQLDMTTAFDFSSATYNGVKTDVISNASVAYITNDGSRLNAQINGTKRVEAYSINGDLATAVSPTPGTAWSGDISTSLVSMKKTLDYSMNATNGFQGFVDNGNKFVTTNGGTITVHDVSTPYDITTGTPGTSATHNLSPYNPGIERAKFSADGTKLYLKYNYYYQDNDKKIREITCNSPFNPNGTIAGTFQGDTQSIYGDGIYDMCTAYDTTKMYILNHNEIIYEYVMVTPGSIASMYWTGASFNAATLDNNPRTIQISDDGTKMFVFGTTDDRVHQLDMTTAFDFVTATYNGVKTDVISNASVAYITNDGSRLNVQINGTKRVEAYSINGDLATVISHTPGTAWSGDISASLVSSYKSITPSMNGGSFYGFVDNGNKFVTTNGGNITVHDVSTPYDIVATTTSTSANYDLSPYNPAIESAKFSADGNKLYLKYNYYYQDNDKKIREITCNSPFNPNGVVAGTFQGDAQSIYGDGVYDMCTSHDIKKMYILNHNEIIYEYVMVTPGSIASMYWTGASFNATTLDSNPRTIQISDDGTKMFVFGSTNNKVFELDMTTAFDLSTATYNSVKTESFPFYDNNINGMWISSDGNSITGRVDAGAVSLYYIDGSQAASLPAVVPPVGYDTSWNFDFDSIIDDKKVHSSVYHTKFVSNDGTKLYQINSTSKIVYQYELSIAHDISSAISGTTGQSSKTLSNLTDYLYNVFVSPDGINLYAIDFDNKLYHYTMSTPHDLSTATYTAVNSGVSTVTQIRNIEFNPDGSGFNIYYAEGVGIVRQYVCPTPWDIVTAYWTSNTYEFTTSNPAHSFQINADGTKAYTFMREDDMVREYTMSTPWDISTMSSTPSNTHYFKNAWEVFISPDGSRAMASTGTTYGYIYRTDGSYHTPVTSSGGSITWAGDITSLVDANKSFDTGYSNGWTLSDDGTKLYTMNGQRVDEHTLSTAHDISSASFDQAVQLGQAPLSPIRGNVNRIHINSAGTKMFVLNDQNPREIYQYDFGTPFDVATLTKSTSPRSDSYFKDVIGETNITDFAMSYDGKKLFHTRGDRIVERVLETAFDITTEYKTGNEYWTGDIDSSPSMLQFSSDGLKLYMFGANTDSMYEFTMTTAYDISTMAYNGTTKRVRGVNLGNLSSDGTKMYVLIGTTLHQYDNS
jgi:hypothetical protein